VADEKNGWGESWCWGEGLYRRGRFRETHPEKKKRSACENLGGKKENRANRQQRRQECVKKKRRLQGGATTDWVREGEKWRS